jgi:hypothetical protein
MQTAAMTQLCMKECKYHARVADECAWSREDDQETEPWRLGTWSSHVATGETVGERREARGIVRRLVAGLRTRAWPAAVE